MAKNFIKGAIKHPGQLHRDLGVPQGEKIPESKIAAAASGKFGPKVEQRAHFAETLKGMHHGKRLAAHHQPKSKEHAEHEFAFGRPRGEA